MLYVFRHTFFIFYLPASSKDAGKQPRLSPETPEGYTLGVSDPELNYLGDGRSVSNQLNS